MYQKHAFNKKKKETILLKAEKHQTLANLLAERIASGEMPPGSKLPSQAEISEEFGVSRSCIHHAMNLLSERELIVRHPGKGVYVARKRESMPEKINNVGCVMPDFQWYDPLDEDNYGLDIFWGIEKELRERELGCQLIRIRPDEITQLPRKIEQFHIDSLILDHRFVDAPWRTLPAGLGVPGVFAGHHGRVPGIGSIVPDYFTAIQELGDRMSEAGKKSVFLLYPGGCNMGKQILASVSALRLEHPGFDVQCYDYMGGKAWVEKDEEFIYRKTSEVIDAHGIPDLFLGHTDWTALRIVEELKRWGIVVPEQTGVAGFLGLGLCERVKPAMTTFALDAQEMGRRSVRMLCRIVKDGIKGCALLEKMPFRYVERESLKL